MELDPVSLDAERGNQCSRPFQRATRDAASRASADSIDPSCIGTFAVRAVLEVPMNDPKKNHEVSVNEPAESAQLTLSDDELKMLDEGELVEVSGGRIGFPPCASAN